MKKLVFCLIFTLTNTITKACVCHPEIFDNYIHADFIGEVKVLKIYKNESPDYHYYKIDAECQTVYKGEKQHVFYIYGSTVENGRWTSCDLTVKENEIWLVYATKSTHGNFEFGMCTKSHKINLSHYDSLAYSKQGLANISDSRKKERNFLLELNKHKNVFDKKYVIDDGLTFIPNIYEYLKTFKGQTFKNDLGLYKIVFNEDFSVKKVIIVKSFGHRFDKKLIDFIKKQNFTNLKRIKKKGSTDGYIPMLIQFYEKEKFLSHSLF